MKNVLKFALILLFIQNSFAQTSFNNFDSVASEGVFKFEKETIDYGKIKQNDDGNRTFVFTNVGNKAIIISKVKASCGCTVASTPNKPVMPGETAEINVKYATNRIGSFSKSITITSNAKNKIKKLRIKGTVLKNVI